MNIKLFELRDHADCIPVMCVQGCANDTPEPDRWLLRTAGWGASDFCYLIVLSDSRCQWDPYCWQPGTIRECHQHIQKNWNTLESGEVIDARVIRGETDKPATSDRFAEGGS